MRQEIALTLIFIVIIATAIAIGRHNPNLYPKISQSSIPGKEIKATVEIYNGNGRKGIAEKVAQTLRASGFDVRKVDNMRNQTYKNTLVISRNGDMKAARAVAAQLSIENPFFLENDIETTNDVTVVLGNSYKEIK